MNENMSYGMESYNLIKNDELIKKLKEKDVHFVKFCLGIYGSQKTKKENRVAIEEDFVFFLSGLHEIKEIISDLTKKMEETTNEEEKREILEELETWKRERNDYYKELSKIESQMEKAHELQKNGRSALNEEKALEYARMIYLITVYDQQKQKIILDGKTDVSELESVVSTLHSIQDKLNLLYQATYQENDLLEEKDVIPRIRNYEETNEEYERYLYQFYHKDNLLPKIEKNAEISIEEPLEKNKQDEAVTVYSDGFENGLTYSLGEQLSKLDLGEEPLEYDSYLDHLDTFLTSPFILKSFSYFDERIENFKKMLYYIQKARESTNDEKYPYYNLYEGLLSNGNDMGELEITNPQEFENEKETFLASLKDYQTEFDKLKINSKDVEFYSKLSMIFQAIYLYDKKKQDYLKNPDEKENLLTIYRYINDHAKELFKVDHFIPNTDLPFAYNDEQIETQNQYTNIFKTPEEDDLTLDDFMTTSPVVAAPVPVNKTYHVVSAEENEEILSEQEKLEKQLETLKAENERLLRENEKLKFAARDSKEQIENLTHENEELKQELESLKGKKKKGGKPFHVIREKAHDLWEKVNKRNVMYAAIGIVSLVMIGAGAMKWKSVSKEPTVAVETVEQPTLANDRIEDMLTMYQKFNDIKKEPLKETIEEPTQVVETPVEETLYDSYKGPHIGDLVTIDLGANVYTDFLVEKDPNTMNTRTGLQRVFKGNYSPDTEMAVLKVAFIDPSDSSKAIIAKSNEEIKNCINNGYQVLSAAVSLNTSLSSVADGLYETDSKQVDDNVTFYVSAQNINQEKGYSR